MASDATVRGFLREAIARLNDAHIDSPALTARLLLATVLNVPKAWLVAHDNEVPSATATAAFERSLARVMVHEPLAYVLGHREFYGLDFVIDPRVLVPRPETEMLVELALAESKIENRKSKILDVGTGSGAVAIAIAKHAPHAQVVASDVSNDALDVARMNALRHGATNVEFVHSDLLAAFDVLDCNVLVANLPYVTCAEIDGLPPEIRAHEPRVALDGGDDGLDLVRALMRQIAFKRGPALTAAFFEIGASQGAAALHEANIIFPDASVALHQDLAKRDRVLAIRFDTSTP